MVSDSSVSLGCDKTARLVKDAVDVGAVIATLMCHWRFILTFTSSILLIFVLYALKLPNYYQSDALLAPAEENSGGGLEALANQFGGLATLAGVNLKGIKSDKTVLALEVMKSREFIISFISTRKIKLELMGAKGWDATQNKLEFDENLVDLDRLTWLEREGVSVEPSELEAYSRFMELFSVSQDNKTSYITVGLKFYSPEISKKWLVWLIEDINQVIRARDISDSKQSIDYLTKELSGTNLAEIRTIFHGLIEEQVKSVMFASVRKEYVFKAIDPPFLPEEKVSPNRTLICILGMIFGVGVSALVVLVRFSIENFRARGRYESAES